MFLQQLLLEAAPGGILYTLPQTQPGHALLTMLPIGIAHVVGCPIRLVVGMSCGPIHCNKLAPVHLQMPESFSQCRTSPRVGFVEV